MKFLTVIQFLWVIFITDYRQWDVPQNNLKLELVQVLFRHGARTPQNNEALLLNITDPDYYAPYGFGQLTDQGKAQNYRLGRLLRQLYSNIISRTFKPDEVHIRCTSVNRTLTSMQFTLAGLYSSSKPAIAQRSFLCPNEEIDVLLKSTNNPEFQKLFVKAQATEEFEKRIDEYDTFYKFIEHHLGMDFEKHKDLKTLWVQTTMRVQRDVNKPLPEWVNDETLELLIELYSLYMDAMSFTPRLRKLNAGPLLRKFLENMKAEESTKMYLYSGHDLNVAAFARVFDIEALRVPDYSSAGILEKWTGDDDKMYVRILYWTGRKETLGVVKIRGCEEYCPLEKFAKIVDYAIPSDQELDQIAEGLRHDFPEFL